MKHVYFLWAMLFAIAAQAQQTTFRIQYNLGEFDIPSGMVQAPSGNYVFSAMVTRNFSGLPLGVQGGLVEVDQNGNHVRSTLYRSGAFTSDVDLADVQNATAGGYIVTGSSGGQCLIAKLTSTGTITWQFRYIPVSGASSYGSRVIQASDGGFVVAGSTSRVDPDGGGAIARQDSSKMFCVKVSSTGTIQWMKTFFYTTAFDDDDYLNDLAEVSDGFVFVGSATIVAGDGQNDAIVLKTDLSGTFQWARRFGNSNSEDIQSVIQDAGNNIVMSGIDNLGGYIYNWSAPNAGPSVIGTNTRYYATGIPVSAGNLTKTADNNFAVFASGVSFPSFTSLIVKANRSTGAVMFARSYNSFISILPTGIQAADSGFLINSLSADTTGMSGFYDFGVTKTDINGNQGTGSTCPPTSPSILTQAYSPTVNTFTPTIVTTSSSSAGGLSITTLTPGVVINCRVIACNAPAMPSLSASPTTICSGSSSTLTASGGSNVTYRYYTQASGGTSIGSGATLSVSPISTTTYYVEADDNTNPGCVSARRSVVVTVNQDPAAVGTITGAASPCPGSQAYSITAVSGATSYTWSVSGGGTITSGQGTTAVTINWTTAGGPYTVSVTATNTCGNTSNTKAVTVQTGPPAAVGAITGDTNPCPGAESYSIAAVANATSYTWSVSAGGTIASGQGTTSISVNWTTSGGPYTVSVTATNSCGTTSNSTSVTVQTAPPAAVGTITGSIAPCPGSQAYSIAAVTNATSYTWSVSGGGTITSGQGTTAININWTTAGGPYTVSVTATNACGSTSNSKTVNVSSAISGVAAAASPNPACVGNTVSLTGSGSSVTTWAWSGPGAYSSSSQSPSLANIQANQAGVYTLTASNACGSATASVNVTVNNVPQSVSATANPNPACAGNTVNLTGSGTNATSWAWSGPNTFTAATQNASVVNAQANASGTYTLTATNTCGTATATVNVTVNTLPLSVTATANPTSVCPGAVMNLSGSATGAVSYAWTGPNAYTSAQLNNTINNFQAANAGTYTLTATNTCGSAQSSVVVSISAGPSNPIASANLTNICSNANLNLTGSATGATSYSWSGPNGFTSAQQNPSNNSVTLADSGLYVLTVSNICGTATASVNVDVDTVIQNLTANAQPNDTICAGANINLTANGTQVNTWSWTGPNAFSSSQQNPVIAGSTTSHSGTYTVTGTNACGSQSSNVVVLVNDPVQSFSASASSNGLACSGSSITLSVTGTNVNGWSWTGPNSFSSTQQNPVINPATTSASGTYTVTAFNACGNQTATVVVQIDTAIENFSLGASPNDTLCAGGTINLSASGTNVTSWNWIGPNGYTSSQQNPTLSSVTVSHSGTYMVTGTNACGSVSDSVMVLVNTIPLTPGTISGSLTTCGNDTSAYTVSNITNATSYNWTLSGGGTIISGQGTTSIMIVWSATAGSYTLSVTASNDCGGSAASTITVNLQAPAPVLNSIIVGDTGVCPGIHPYSISNIPNATNYNWTLNGGGTIANGQGTIAVNVDWTTAGNHTVSVTASNTCGTSSSATLNVNVYPSPTAATVSLSDDTICEGNNTTLTATNSTGGSVSYNFYDAASGGILLGASPLTVSPATTTVYYLEVINEFGCTNSSGRIPVTVYVIAAPTVLGITVEEDSLCYGRTTTLTANVSPAGTTVTWWDNAIGGNLLASGNTYTTDALTQTSTFYAQATSSGGCQNLQGRVPVVVTVIALPVVTLISDKDNHTIFPNEVINFTAIPDSFENYEFFWNGTSVQSGDLNTWASSKLNDLDSIWVIATDNGCESVRSEVIVRVVDFPNAFTPNSDGTNDVFLEGYDLVIINRWGQELYEGREGWDGKYKGDKVSPGTYYYIVMLDNITDRKNAIKGNVLLIED